MDVNPYLDIILRSAAVYLFLVLAIRLFGKKELSQLSTTDLVFIVLISNSVQNAMVGSNSSLLGGITAATVLFLLNYILKLIMYRSVIFKGIVEGNAVILVHDGKLYIDRLHKEHITIEELEEAVREHGVDSYKHVKLAIMEVDGNISVISVEGKGLRQTHHKRRKSKSLTRVT